MRPRRHRTDPAQPRCPLAVRNAQLSRIAARRLRATAAWLVTNMSRPRLLLIEDNRDAVVATAHLLSSYGFGVEIARTAEDGVDKATRLHPDVIVTDVLLPNGSAHDVCRQLQHHAAMRKTPVIAYTGVVDADALAALFRLGVRVFAIKPCVPQVLAAEARMLLDEGRRPTTARVVTGYGETLESFAALIDARALGSMA
jgi:DNA-binding response OmpR family regulator